MKVIAHTDLTAIEEIRLRWSDLWKIQDSPLPCSHPSWLVSWYRHFISDIEPLVLVSYDGSTIVGVAPLMRLRHSHGDFASGTVMSAAFNTVDYSDILVHDPKAIEPFLNAVVKFCGDDGLVLQNLRDDSPTTRILRDSERLNVSVLHAVKAPYAQLNLMEQGVGHFIGRERRKSLRRRGRIGERLGISYTIDVDLNTVDEVWFSGQSAKLQKEGLAAQGISSNFSDPRLVSFYIDLLRWLHTDNRLSLSLGKVDDRLVAFQVCMRNNFTLFAWITGYHRDFASASPGFHMLYKLLEVYIRNGFKELDLMRGEEAYKAEWSTNAREISTYHVGINEACKRE